MNKSLAVRRKLPILVRNVPHCPYKKSSVYVFSPVKKLSSSVLFLLMCRVFRRYSLIAVSNWYWNGANIRSVKKLSGKSSLTPSFTIIIHSKKRYRKCSAEISVSTLTRVQNQTLTEFFIRQVIWSSLSCAYQRYVFHFFIVSRLAKCDALQGDVNILVMQTFFISY